VSVAILVVSRESLTVPEVPPPMRSVPAVTPVMVPPPLMPGKVWPVANLMMPLLLMARPVSAGVTPLP
jgi:hypothetical protein